jgi:hypothetical protein
MLYKATSRSEDAKRNIVEAMICLKNATPKITLGKQVRRLNLKMLHICDLGLHLSSQLPPL